MSLEKEIERILKEQMDNGIVEKVIAQEFEKGLTSATEHLFRSYGDITETLEKKIKEVMIPHVEKYDYSKYITKLDAVLIEILNQTALDHTKILDNFKSLMQPNDFPKVMKATDVFEKWVKYVAENVETDGLEVEYDDSPSYEYVSVTMEFTEEEDRYDWTSYLDGKLVFECSHDPSLNVSIPLSLYKKEKERGWDMESSLRIDFGSLRTVDEFSIFLHQLKQAGTRIEMDSAYEEEDVRPEQGPEAEWS